MRIVFMGTPQYSVASLVRLTEAGHIIEAVFAQPDKPVGRKQILTVPPTKIFALEHDIPVFQPNTLNDDDLLMQLKAINPELIVVVAYGKLLPKSILSLPEYGCINGHASLLPKLRGASPIQWAIVTGETETGVTVMQMDEGMDTGDILSFTKTVILPEDTAETLFDRLSVLTADLLVKTISDIEKGSVFPRKQDDNKATYAPIIKKEMAHIDFGKNAENIVCSIRGFYPWPIAYCFADSRRMKVLKARQAYCDTGLCGEVMVSDGRLVVSCGENTAVEFLTVQPEGSKVMSAADMLRGNPIKVGTLFS